MAMIRKQVFVTQEQSRQLRARARAQGISEAEIIRAGIDQALAAANGESDWKERILKTAGCLKDASGLESNVKENRARWKSRSERTRRMLAGEE